MLINTTDVLYWDTKSPKGKGMLSHHPVCQTVPQTIFTSSQKLKQERHALIPIGTLTGTTAKAPVRVSEDSQGTQNNKVPTKSPKSKPTKNELRITVITKNRDFFSSLDKFYMPLKLSAHLLYLFRNNNFSLILFQFLTFFNNGKEHTLTLYQAATVLSFANIFLFFIL